MWGAYDISNGYIFWDAPDRVSGQIVKNFTIRYPAELPDIYSIQFSIKNALIDNTKGHKSSWLLVSF